MCGICGIYELENELVSKEKISSMMNALIHRGPDDSGSYIKENVGLGHRRLSIIDLSINGRNPLSNEDNTLFIVFNGEVYNFKELRVELEKKGHFFKSNTDTEVVLHLYEEEKENCVKKLRGMFAFAIWDEKNKKIFLARDRLGEKPLVYGIVENKFLFASEIKSVLAASEKKLSIDLEGLHHYFNYNFFHVPEPYTIFREIKKLPSACWMVFDPSKKQKITIKKYWKPDYNKKKYKNILGAVNEYKNLIKDTVNSMEVADVPIGALLSGGVDSSTVVALMKNKIVKTYSIGYGKDDFELQRARKVSKIYKTKNKEVLFSKDDLLLMPEVIHYLGEPLNLMPSIYSLKLCKEVKKDLKVVLGGNGGDELFYGYDGSNSLLLLNKLIKFEDFIPKSLLRLMAKHANKKSDFYLLCSMLLAPKEKKKGEIYRIKGEELRKKLYTKNALKSLKKLDDGKLIDDLWKECNSREFIEKMYYTGLMLENAHSTTIIGDVTGMANSVEIRSPFLDYRLAEFAAALPVKYKVKSLFSKKYNKYIIKKGAESFLPKEIIYGKKAGFGYNINWPDLLKKEWKQAIINYFEKIDHLDIFDKKKFLFMMENHSNSIENNSKLIMGIFVFAIWHELIVKNRDLDDVKKELENMIK